MSVWLLPEKISDILPLEARKIEELRRRLLDRFRIYGYELVMPPTLEYLESLLSSASPDLELNTFKLVDQLSGRSMGIRADITPQVSRIDAHLLNRQGISRLCYAGSVLQTRPVGLHATREPYQVGAEIFGHPGLEADAEMQQLAIDSLALAGLSDMRLDLCHFGVLEALLDASPIARARGYQIFAALGGKDIPRLIELSADLPIDIARALQTLPKLYGESDVLERAKLELPPFPDILCSLKDLEYLAAQARGAQVLIDLADLRGYRYHSGAMFSIYANGVSSALARGGRYDKVAMKFGRERPATGFSLDLREVAHISPIESHASAIFAPFDDDPALKNLVRALRDAGEIVIQAFPGEPSTLEEFECDRELVINEAGKWEIVIRGNTQ